jgi:hypothetical protein
MKRLGFAPASKGQGRIEGIKRVVYASHKGISKSDWDYLCKIYFDKSFYVSQRNWPSLSKLVSESI